MYSKFYASNMEYFSLIAIKYCIYYIIYESFRYEFGI